MNRILKRVTFPPEQVAGIVVILIGYGLAILDTIDEPVFPYSALETAALVLIAAVYLYLMVREEQILGPNPRPFWLALFFAICLLLLIGGQALLQTIVGAWLASMPLVAMAVTRLSPLWRWPVYLGVLAGLTVPVAFRFGPEAAVNVGVSFVPAIVFVVIFVRLLVRSEEARRTAEGLAGKLEAANRQLALYVTQAEELATSKERNRLAREIHDSLGHYLTVINVQLEAARAVMAADPARALDALVKAQTLAREGLGAVRQSVAALRESPLSQRSLAEAIATLVEESNSAGILSELVVQGAWRPLDAKSELALYRAAQEGLTNVRKHARASRVDLLLDFSHPAKVRLVIQDNGVGAAAQGANGGFGLVGIRERVSLLGGELQMATAPGEGYRLAVELPG
jgi:signal transduction histidine kinase